MKYSIFIMLLLLLNFYSNAEKAYKKSDRPIKILNWWNYIDSKVIKRVKDSNFKMEITTYRSNEVALARVLTNKDNFDVVIISNTNLEILAKTDILDPRVSKKIRSERKYLDIMPNVDQCIPYLWGSTIFSYDSRSISKPPRNLKQLYNLKRDGFKIGFLDEPLEMVARLIGDSMNKCLKKEVGDIFSMLVSCNELSLEKIDFPISSSDFITSYDEFIKGENVAAYGWQGSVFLNLQSAPWVKFNISESYPVIGGDFVCILKNETNQASRNKEIENFVRLITDKESTKLNIETSQYFSPYTNDTELLQPRVLEVYEQLMTKIKSKNTLYIKAPNENELSQINKWWKKVRYSSN